MQTTSMAFLDKQKSLLPPPAYAHRHPFHHNHHRCLQISSQCPLHSSYLLLPNGHPLHHSPATADGVHHYHLELSPDCPLHGHLLPHCPLHSPYFYSNNQSMIRFPITPNFAANHNDNNLNSIPPEADTNCKFEALMMQDRNEEVEEDDDDEEEVIFVLTDEWKEFFAKSEAKRRSAKKQAKKKGKD